MKFIDWNTLPNWATAIGTVFTAIAACVAVYKIFQESRTKRVDRTYSLLHEYSAEFSDEEGALLMEYFPGRWKIPIEPLSATEAEELWSYSNKRHEQSPGAKRYNAARRHLNRLAPLAGAYLYKTGEPELIAREVYRSMASSNTYFSALIDAARLELGPSQGWQEIPRAVAAMEAKYGSRCERLFQR